MSIPLRQPLPHMIFFVPSLKEKQVLERPQIKQLVMDELNIKDLIIKVTRSKNARVPVK